MKVYGDDGFATGPTRLQVFEVAVAALFARLRPDYEWYVTPNRPDGGVDFVGQQGFLKDEELGIAAAITIGGQCKKRSRVDDIVGEVAGSLARMASAIDPTFFVVALSARLNRARVDDARAILERTYQRHCHILDRHQIEGLLHDHLASIGDILREGLSDDELADVLKYFDAYADERVSPSLEVTVPDRVLAGVPFTVTVSVRSSIVSAPGARLWWRPSGPADADHSVRLIGPVSADAAAGAEIAPARAIDDPLQAQLSIELVTYAVGAVDLGEVRVGHGADGAANAGARIDLGTPHVVENVRPPFFDRPLRTPLERLGQEYERALARGVGSIGVVGAGGSGKSRLCEEFALERRRRGSGVVVAKQAKTLDEPQRVLADLFSGLVTGDASPGDPADRVARGIERYDRVLAGRAEPGIRAIFGRRDGTWGAAQEQDLLSALLLLIVARGRRAPLIVHLQDLHWCTADVLVLLERLVWQLDQILSAPQAALRDPESGVLFILEGRIRERQAFAGGWTSEPFEAFLQKLDCPTVTCSSFERHEGLDFIRLLFEGGQGANRPVSDDLLELQDDLIARIDRSAGGSPFHSLEQVRLLKERRIIGQNPATGRVYLIQPSLGGSDLPDSVFESIRLRWQYLRDRQPALALLVWAAALLEDRIPTPLFRELLREIAPDVSFRDVDATEILWTGDAQEREVSFRHENYFDSVRRFEVSSSDRRRIVAIYSDWFNRSRTGDPADQFRWARVLLELPEPDVARARKLLTAALRGARRRGDTPLARRIASAVLDLTWSEDARTPVRAATFLRSCDDDLALTRDLLGSDRLQAARRLDPLEARLDQRLSSGGGRPARTLRALERRRLTCDVLRSQILFNDQRPAQAAKLAARAVRKVEALRSDRPSEDDTAREALEMEALHSQAVALALSGEIGKALRTSELAVGIARRSSSTLSQHVISTYANILLTKDPEESESILRDGLANLGEAAPSDLRHEAEINLSMALVLRAHRLVPGEEGSARAMLIEADNRLRAVFASCNRLGQYPDAGAAALMVGIVRASRAGGDEVFWFAQAVAAASRGGQMETLWRAHINLATAMHGGSGAVDETVRDHARAALEILEATLSTYSHPDRSPRFEMVRGPLAQAVRFLVLAGDDRGLAALERYPALRTSFEDPQAGLLREERPLRVGHEWLRVGQQHYVLY